MERPLEIIGGGMKESGWTYSVNEIESESEWAYTFQTNARFGIDEWGTSEATSSQMSTNDHNI